MPDLDALACNVSEAYLQPDAQGRPRLFFTLEVSYQTLRMAAGVWDNSRTDASKDVALNAFLEDHASLWGDLLDAIGITLIEEILCLKFVAQEREAKKGRKLLKELAKAKPVSKRKQ